MEKTFEELTEKFKVYNEVDFRRISYRESVVELLKQVREATIAEIYNEANEYGDLATADYVSDMATERIKLTDK